MKAITRNKIKDTAKRYVAEEYNNLKYETFQEVAPEVTRQAVTMFLYALKLYGHFGTTRLQRAFDWFILVQNMPPILGKEMKCENVMRMLERDHGIDFSRINVKLESKENFMKR